MIFVFGPLGAGKHAYIREVLGLADAVYEVQRLAAEAKTPAELEALADRLAGHAAVCATEVGCGVVPADPEQRAAREQAGRLNILLARRAQKVVRVWCGIAEELR